MTSTLPKPEPEVMQSSTSTPPPTPPDLQPFPQLDHPYTDIGGKCHFCVCPEAEHSDEYSVQSLVTHVGHGPPLALILTRRTKRDGFIYDWYIVDSEGWELTCQPTEIDALRMAEMYAKGFKRGSIQSRYGVMHPGEERPYHAQQLRP